MMLLGYLITLLCLECSSAVFWSKRNEVETTAVTCPSNGVFCKDCLNSVFCNGGTATELPCGEGEVCAGDPGFAGCRQYIGEDAGACDCDNVGNSGFLTDPYDPAKYIICVPPEGQYFASCTNDQVFNDATGKCEDGPPPPECNEVGFQTNDPTCSTYYICTSTSLPGIMLSCGVGQAFDTTQRTCVDQCSLGPESFTCPSSGSGAFPDTADCSIFHVCSNGLVVVGSVACPDGELFNSGTMACESTSAEVVASCPSINPCWSTYCEACTGSTCDYIMSTQSSSTATSISTPISSDSTLSPSSDTTAASASITTTATTTITSTAATTVTSTTTKDPAALKRLPCQCGQVTRTDSNWHSLYNHPWTVALLQASDSKHFCSATIVNTLYIITAASCMQGQTTSSFVIRANEHELGTKLPRAITRSPRQFEVSGDIALIEMTTAISLTQYDAVKPACLPGPDMDFVGGAATHSGYDHGKNMKNDGTLSSGSSSSRLNFSPSGHAFCREDLGGPVVSPDDVSGKRYLAGIAIDTSCSSSSQPVAKISEYYDWIYDKSNTGRFCQQ